jgi:hypothetical protein
MVHIFRPKDTFPVIAKRDPFGGGSRYPPEKIARMEPLVPERYLHRRPIVYLLEKWLAILSS